MQPESSDGLASVGTILPEEGAALLPGGSFRFMALPGRSARSPANSSPLPRAWTHIASPPSPIQARFQGIGAAAFREFGCPGGSVTCPARRLVLPDALGCWVWL